MKTRPSVCLKQKIRKCDEFRFIIRQVNKILLDKRRPFLKRHVSDVIEALEIESAFPNYDKDNLVDVFKKNQIERFSFESVYCTT